jgi:predicted TIM-barrel fold metal-dependent hydrolase
MNKLKVIDFHVHVGLLEHWKDWVKDYGKAAQSEFYKRYDEMIVPEKFAAHLKKNNIAKAVILPEINPNVTGVVPNEYVFEFCQDFDVFIPFCTINPAMSENLGKDFEKYIQMGANGIKLYPSYSFFYPNEITLYPVYEIAQEFQLPVLVHTGSSIFRGSKIKYADPIHLDDVATDFPELPILMAHSGRGLWYERAFFLSRLHPNLYLEISGLPPKKLLEYFPELEKNIDKVVYGSDWPGIQTISQNIMAIQELPLAKDSIEKILYGNAAKILGQSKKP